MNLIEINKTTIGSRAFRQLANVASILGLLPLCLLFPDGGYAYLLLFIVYNNFMDDLDGLLAAKLNIRSQFGANLDNVCDAIAHTAIVMLVGMHFGGVCAMASVVAAAAIVIRGVARLDPKAEKGGSPTNELIRHTLFILLLAELTGGPATPFLVAAFLVHSVSMLVPYKLPWLIRSKTRSMTAIGLLNASLLVAVLVPWATPVVATAFMGSYAYSFFVASVRQLGALPVPPIQEIAVKV